jgi:molecular chaperone DnaK
MNRYTIDYGIDLGTTNSEIAVLKGTEIEVFKNNEGMEFTPSAVWIDRKNNLYVGRRAKERIEDDPENAYCEFKLQMGTPNEYLFARSGRRMKPEELSAEILKELKGYVQKRTGEVLQAAVITVPAAFEAPQCKATLKAAQDAGFVASPLVLEPVAAAQAYGFDSASDKVFWLVFDFGGGTFDAALIQLREGIIQVINHGGDNHLGGKLIDWAIVEQLLIPAVTRDYNLPDFRRGNPRWRAAIAKLKWHAEQAKIRASADPSADILIDFLCQDDGGEPIRFEYELKREDVQRLATPFFLRAINIAKTVLTEKRLSSGHIEKVVLVGGPTQMPCLRETLLDPREGLGIPLEYRVDPLTVVARGAAVFARTQRLPDRLSMTPPAPGQYSVKLEYSPAGPDPEPPVSGTVTAPQGNPISGVTIEFVNPTARPPWRSGKLPLSPTGTFMTMVLAEKGKLNSFSIELCDAQGTRQACTPDNFAYTCINVGNNQIIIHSLGVAKANNQTECLLEKGQAIPAKKRVSLKTALPARMGQPGAIFRVPIVEGERSRADRNRYVGSIELLGHQLKRDLPAGVDVEITMEVTEPGKIQTKAFIPFLDEEVDTLLELKKLQPDPETLRQEVEYERKRLAEVRSQAARTSEPKASRVLDQIDREDMEREIDTGLAAARVDPDAADKAQNRLLDLKVAVDEIQELLEWPNLLAETEKQLQQLRQLVQTRGNPSQKQNFDSLETEVRKAMAQRDPDLLKSRLADAGTIAAQVLLEDYQTLVAWFMLLQTMKAQMTDPAQADQWFAQGQRAINGNDKTALQTAVIQLHKLLPRAQQAAFDERMRSTVQ